MYANNVKGMIENTQNAFVKINVHIFTTRYLNMTDSWYLLQ